MILLCIIIAYSILRYETDSEEQKGNWFLLNKNFFMIETFVHYPKKYTFMWIIKNLVEKEIIKLFVGRNDIYIQ